MDAVNYAISAEFFPPKYLKIYLCFQKKVLGARKNRKVAKKWFDFW